MRLYSISPGTVRALGLSATMSLSLMACSLLGVEENGSQCGGAQYASARMSLPDTGISAGSEVLFVFTQRDPYLIPEQADISIQQLPMPGVSLILPHVRLVHDDGRVLLDQSSTSSSLGQSWSVIYITHSAEVRNTIFEALRTQNISLQLVRWPSDQPGTTVRIRPDELGVSPIAWCV